MDDAFQHRYSQSTAYGIGDRFLLYPWDKDHVMPFGRLRGARGGTTGEHHRCHEMSG